MDTFLHALQMLHFTVQDLRSLGGFVETTAHFLPWSKQSGKSRGEYIPLHGMKSLVSEYSSCKTTAQIK